MSQADTGQTVRVHYRGTLDNGEEFDSSHGRGEPFEFTIGIDRMIPSFSQAIVGMSLGESKSIDIPAEEAYGPYNEEMVKEFDRGEFPTEIEFREGMILSADSPQGQKVHFKVLSFDDQVVKLDGNHPLAGENLHFEIELLEIL